MWLSDMVVDRTSPGFSIEVTSRSRDFVVRAIKSLNNPVFGGAQYLLGATSIQNISDRIEKLSFVDSEKELDVLTLTVNNHDLYFFNHPAFVQGNILKFSFGYPGQIFGPRVHIVDSMEGFETLKIKCLEWAVLSNQEKTRWFKNMTRLEVVNKILKEDFQWGVDSVIDASSLSLDKPKSWNQVKETDLGFIKRISESAGYEVYFEGTTFHFHPPQFGTSPIRTYKYFSGKGDLLSFSLTEYKFSGKAAYVNIMSRNPIERKDISAIGSDKDTERDTLGGQGAITINRDRSTGDLLQNKLRGKRVVLTPEYVDQLPKELADSQFKRSEEVEVKAEAVVIGDPFLGAKKIIIIENVGRQFSGKYYISEAEHLIDKSNGYVTKLKLIKNAVTSTMTGSDTTLDEAKAKINTKQTTITRLLPTGDLVVTQE